LDAYASFRSRDFRFLIAGNFLATLGLQMLSVAVSWDLYLASKSALVLGNVGLVQVTPFVVFALFAGRIADHYDRRRVIILTQLLLLTASVALVIATRSVAMIYTCLFLTATSRAFQGPARLAVLPHAVPPESLQNAITWSSSAQEIASVSGPAVAGFLLASAGSKSVYLIQSLCAILTLLCFASLKFPNRIRSEVPSPPSGRALLEGVRFVWRDKLILPAISLDLFAVLFGGASALLPIYAIEILHTDVRGLGWLRAAPSIGAVTIAFLMTHLPKARHAGQWLLWCVAGFGAATIVFGLSHWLWLSFAMLVLTGVFDNVSVVLRHSLVQTRTPDHVRGRVLAVNNIFISSSNQLGAVESGWTAAWFGPVVSVVAGGLATLAIVAGFAARSEALRKWKQ
jgi:MFS family permease